MKKKLFAILFVAVTSLIVFAISASAATGTSGTCNYTYDKETGVLTVTPVGETGAPNAISEARSATQIIFSEGVTAVSASLCYNNSNLTSVTLPSTITSIGSNAFNNATNLSTVTIADGAQITEVGKNAFFSTSITEFSADVTTVGDYAFRKCYRLTKIDLGENVENYGVYAFADCVSLNSFNANGTFTTVANYSFWNCEKLPSIELPETVTTIGVGAFNNTKLLKTVNLPAALTKISNNAFKYSGIEGNIVIPEGVTSIGDNAFYFCPNIGSVTLPSSLKTIGKYCFAESSITSTSIPAGVTAIPVRLFYNCANLTCVDLPTSITSIGTYAFAASKINSVVIPEGCTTLGNGVFWSCQSLVSAEIKAPLNAIPMKTFMKCSALKTVNIPDTVVNLAPYCFYYCSSLENINIPSGLKLLQCYAFENTTNLKIDIVIPGGLIAPTYSENGTSLSTIGDKCFKGSGITSVTFGEGIESIGYESFRGCSNLTEITLPESCTTVLGNAFRSCGITEATIPSVNSFGDKYIFYGNPTKVLVRTLESNNYVTNWVANQGSNVTLGDYIVTEPDVCSHANTTIVSAVAPTCTATGLTEGSECADCGEVLVAQEVVAALGHTEVVDEAVAATCTATGLTEGKHCDICGEVLVAQETVAALGHTEVVDEAVAATCTATGLTEGKHCDICGDVIVAQETVAALGHTEVVDEAVAATCTATGLTEGKHCDVCGEVLVAQEVVAALGHSYGDAVVTEATPWEAGKSVQTCANCGDEIKEEIAFVGSALGLDVVVDGNTATATLQLFNAPELTSVAFSIKYKGADLVLTAANTAITHGYTTDPSIANPVKFVWINGLENADINGTVATFTFTVNEGSVVDTGDFNISYDADDVCALDEAGELVNVDLAIYVRVN